MSEIRFRFSEGLNFSDSGAAVNCGVCLAFFKAAVIAALGNRIGQVEQDGKEGVVWLVPPPGVKLPPIQGAVTMGTSHMAPQLGTTLLCESHAPAIAPQTSRLALGQGPLPPGLTMGRG